MFNIPKIAKKADTKPLKSISPKRSLLLYQLKIINAIIIEKKEIKYLYFFGVTSELRGKGIVTKMLKHILEKVSSIYLWPISTRLTQWYEAHGFHHSSSGYYNYHKYGTRLNLNSLRNPFIKNL